MTHWTCRFSVRAFIKSMLSFRLAELKERTGEQRAEAFTEFSYACDVLMYLNIHIQYWIVSVSGYVIVFIFGIKIAPNNDDNTDHITDWCKWKTETEHHTMQVNMDEEKQHLTHIQYILRIRQNNNETPNESNTKNLDSFVSQRTYIVFGIKWV